MFLSIPYLPLTQGGDRGGEAAETPIGRTLKEGTNGKDVGESRPVTLR